MCETQASNSLVRSFLSFFLNFSELKPSGILHHFQWMMNGRTVLFCDLSKAGTSVWILVAAPFILVCIVFQHEEMANMYDNKKDTVVRESWWSCLRNWSSSHSMNFCSNWIQKQIPTSRSWEYIGLFTECVNVCCKLDSKNGFCACSKEQIEYKFQVEKSIPVDGRISSRMSGQGYLLCLIWEFVQFCVATHLN